MDVIKESRKALKRLDWRQVDATVSALQSAERVFCVGNGGGYAHAMHFASDLRKIAGKQAFSPDNFAEISARANDQSWDDAIRDWRGAFHYDASKDVSFMFSCGGGMDEASYNIHWAVLGIVGQRGGTGGMRIVIPSTSTPVIEGCQSVIAHHIVEQLCK